MWLKPRQRWQGGWVTPLGYPLIYCRCATRDPSSTNSPISKREKGDYGMLSANLYALVGGFNFIALYGPFIERTDNIHYLYWIP